MAALCNVAYLLGLSLQVCPFMALGYSATLLQLVSNPLLLMVLSDTNALSDPMGRCLPALSFSQGVVRLAFLLLY